MEIDDITAEIVDAAVKLHVRLGPGLLESVYEAVLARELVRRGSPFSGGSRSDSSSMGCGSRRGCGWIYW